MPINNNNNLGALYSVLKAKMIEALNLVATSARRNAFWSTKIRSAIRVGEVKEQGGIVAGYVEVPLRSAPEARAFEYGSGIHSTKGVAETYPIRPVNATALVFPGTHEWAGKTIVVPPMGGGVVMHPGVEPRPFLTPAVEENQERIRALLGSSIRQYIGTIIMRSWSRTK
jgi:hypothetical protein